MRLKTLALAMAMALALAMATNKEGGHEVKEDTRKIILEAIEYSRESNIHALDRVATIRGMLLAALEVEDRK